jgi:hypothetical protein
MTAMRFAVETFEKWHEEAAPLFRAHWELVGRHKDLVPLEVDVKRWIRIEREGLVAAFSARIGWKLEGYALYLTSPSLNYRDRVFGYCHAIYIDPAQLVGFRARRFRRFIEFCDAELKRRGCVKSVMHMKLSHNFMRMIAPLGYEQSELLAERVL